MASPSESDAGSVRVGVLLDREPDGIGEWLAEAAAFDAGGADALWADCGPDWDGLALAAALAVVTYRARLVVADSGAADRTVDTVRRLSRGRLALLGESGAARRVPGEPQSFECDGLWVAVPVPEGRADWRAVRADAAGRGAHGVVVPADPRLLDLLRNPDDPGERTDLQLAQG